MADGALPTTGDQAVADTQTEIKKPSVMDDLQAERAKLYQIQAELMRQIEDRSKPDPSAFWASMARGFGNPNTPSFAGGAAGFAGNLQASQEEERKRAIETAQMRMQLAQSQLAMKRSDVVGQALFGGQETSKDSVDSVAQAAGVSPNVARAMPPDLKKAVMLQWMQGDEKGAIDTMAKFALENAKTPDELKVAQQLAAMFPGANANNLMRFFAANKLVGDPNQIMSSILSIKKAMDEESISRPDGNAMIAILQSRLNAGNAPQTNIVAPSVSAPSAPAASPITAKTAATPTPAGFPRVSTEEQAQRDSGRAKILQKELDQERQKLSSATNEDQRRIAQQNIASLERELGASAKPAAQSSTGEPLTKRERELQSAEDVKRMESDVKRQSELEGMWSDDAKRARDEIRDAKTVHKVVGENQRGFGLLSKPGSALAYAAQAGFRIGDKSVGINELEQSLLRSGIFSQQEINAVSIVHQIALKWQLAVAAAQKGAVSNYERTLFGQAGLNISDDPKIIQYKAALIDAQARNRQEVWDKYQEFKQSNKRGNIEDFQRTNAFKDLQNRFDQKLDRIREAYSK